MNIKKLNEQLEKFLSINEISDELVDKVHSRREHNFLNHAKGRSTEKLRNNIRLMNNRKPQNEQPQETKPIKPEKKQRTWEEIKQELIDLVRKAGKDDVKFVLFSKKYGDSRHYFDNCLKLDDVLYYNKSEYPIRALTYDGTLNAVTRVDNGERPITDDMLNPQEQEKLLSMAKYAASIA